ncbi:homoserine O-acetyltransferase [Luminiphilus syltensis NOR5-1B]|uniref:Homoserine O-succinyltransferase n=1 Tax=Luminiphilus syltensis NOR5-1B TaxID=565045 RepID=B8KU79_9GAMM|nr:homoserine O-acetyltransferase [Luminiphilus syltensis]EED34498.1 homoserine O-acetyltransferase [Luminiphilus syltensis NOR5-1B]
MTGVDSAGSVGLVIPFVEVFEEPLTLACGRTLDRFELVLETYGVLNADASNAILICHALSGNHHAAGFHSRDERKPGWWDVAIGPGKAIDTDRFFVVSVNNLGGCHGSTGPASINPATGSPWGPDFPQIQIDDWVESQRRLAQRLGISRWAAVIGGSLGGMQALQWAVSYPDWLDHCVVLASAPRLSAQNIAFNEIARHAILSDPDWLDGHYYQNDRIPEKGLGLARMVGHLTYMSADGMSDKFGRELREGSLGSEESDAVVFQVESYLRYQGAQFSTRFDANTYMLMTRALDFFDISRDHDGDLRRALANTTASFLVLSFSSDWRFSPARSQELVDALLAEGKPVTYADIEANEGHDSFLIDVPGYLPLFTAYMARVGC